jgi:hypothetical protein
MVHPHRTMHKSTSHQPAGELAPRDVPQPQKPHHDSPQNASQEEEPFEIELVVFGSPAAQGAPAEEQKQQQDHDNKDKDDVEYSPLSDNEREKLYRDADERESFGAEALVPTDRLCAPLGHLGITSTPRYRIKGVPCLGWVEFKAAAEIFSGSWVLCGHQGPALRASISDAVADAAWQANTSWIHRNKDELQNSIHRLLPQ